MEEETKWGTRCPYCNKKLLVIFKEDGLPEVRKGWEGGENVEEKEEKKRTETPIIDLAEDLMVSMVKLPFKLLRATKKVLVES